MVTYNLGTARGLKILVSFVGFRRCLVTELRGKFVMPLITIMSEYSSYEAF